MNEGKKEFVKALRDALKIDSSSGAKSIEYIRSVKAKERSYDEDQYKEIVRIEYIGRFVTLINIEANSNGGIAKKIISEVYGSGDAGLIFYGADEEECD